MTSERVGPILVPLDGSIPAERPLKVARAAADIRATTFVVLYVSAEPMSAEEVVAKLDIPDYQRGTFEVRNAVGEAVKEIARVAAELDADSIMLSSHGHTGDLEALAGHVTLRVLRDPPCPVLVVRSALDYFSQAQRLRHLRRVLVPLDGTPEATAAVRGAVGIAKATGSRLLLLHIIDARPGTARAPASPSYLDQGPYEMEAWREEFLRGSFAMTRAPRGVQTEVALRVGDPGKEIARFAAQRDCDLILAAWSGKLHPGRARVVSTLLQNSPCPLLFLRAP